MADTFSKKKRSEIMSKVKGKDTSIEVKFRKALWHSGYRYRTHVKMPGNPDIVFGKHKIAIFIDGCFWHGCEACKKPLPKTNERYWTEKIEKNVARDAKATERLESQGWRVIRIWEHDIKTKKKFSDALNATISELDTLMTVTE